MKFDSILTFGMECEKVIPNDILVDLCSRFVINVPIEEQSDLTRICFQVELAHWFYIDFYSKNFPNKRPCGLKEFTLQVFKHIPFLQPFAKNIDQVIEEWKDYKFSVPTYGAIVLNEDLTHVLLVQNYKSCWGFPKGKVNKDEPADQCAIREVYEETGFDISNLIDPNNYLEATLNERVIRLYVVPGVSKSEEFVPKTRNEIKAIDWFPISDIPLSKKDAANKLLKLGSGNTSNAVYSAFYMVSPFIRKIKQWIYEHCNNIPHQRRRQRHKSCSDIDKVKSLDLSESVEMLRRYQSSGKNIAVEMSKTRNSRADTKTLVEVYNASQQINKMTIGPEVSSILNDEGVHTKPFLEQKVSGNWNASMNPARPMPSILSTESAFRKVEKTPKLNKRKRKNKNAGVKDNCEIPSHQSDNIQIERKVIECIPSLMNFQFDIGAILQSINDAVIK